MVNPAFSESQLKNLRRQNRHLVSTHRRKLVFLQASRNPAHGSGRPFFVRDVPVPASFCSVPVASAFAPPAPVSAAPQLRPFHRPRRSVPSSPSRSRTPDKVRVCTVHAAVPHPHPARRERSLRHLSARPLSLRPSPLRLPLPPLPSSDRSAVLTASALVFQPLPHAGQSSGPYCARCRSASPPGTPGTVPSDIFLPGLRPSGSRFRRSAVFALSRRGSAPPRGDRPNRLLLRPGTRKGLSDRSQTAPFLSVCYSGTSPNTQFSENWKNSSDGPLHSYSRSRTSPPPSEHAAQRIEKLAGQLRPLPNRAAGRPPSRPGSGGAQQFIAPQQWIT